MPKMIKNCFYDKLTFENFLEAHKRARKNKTNKKELLKFEVDLETNIINIMRQLKSGNYSLGKYRVFTIYESKERIIKCLPYKDRIVQQWYIHEFIKPYIIPRLINTTCACIDNKGTHYAVNLVEKYMRIMKRDYLEYYILKLDIKKYFYNIDKDILFDIMSEYISDKRLLELTAIFIYDSDDKVGIPIGNYTSQYFANIYLDKLDKYIKEDLNIKYYVRYMDDMVILLPTKDDCIVIMNRVKKFVSDGLNLDLNKKSRYYPSRLGVNFCGYRIFETHRLLRVGSKQKIKRKIKMWEDLYKREILDRKKVKLSLNSWVAHSSHANTYRLQCKIKEKINNLGKDIGKK